VLTESGEILDCKLRGKFRVQELKSTNPVAVGDIVRIELEEKSASITEIEKRRNYILRKSVNLSARMHILCANVDQALILFTIANPVTTLGYVDRLLVSCEAYGIKAVVIFNKMDKLESDKELQKLREFAATYSQIGYQVIMTNAKDAKHRDNLVGILKDKVSFVVGRSGAGKSTLINLAEPMLKLKTSDTSGGEGRGRHTTTYAEMFNLSFGGSIIDSPGFREMEIYDIRKDELAHFFPEMLQALPSCKYKNCNHVNEPGCRVRAAVEKGQISESRYHTYLGMLQEVE